MQIVIDIPEEKYKVIQAGNYCGILDDELYYAIKNGTPLPKGHGRLIDADKLLDSDGIIADSRKCHYIPVLDVYFHQQL